MYERIMLQAVRAHGPCQKSEIARLTHLRTKNALKIVDSLMEDGSIVREARTRVLGRMG